MKKQLISSSLLLSMLVPLSSNAFSYSHEDVKQRFEIIQQLEQSSEEESDQEETTASEHPSMASCMRLSPASIYKAVCEYPYAEIAHSAYETCQATYKAVCEYPYILSAFYTSVACYKTYLRAKDCVDEACAQTKERLQSYGQAAHQMMMQLLKHPYVSMAKETTEACYSATWKFIEQNMKTEDYIDPMG